MLAFGCDIGNGFGYVSLLSDEKSDPFPMIPPKYRLPMGMPTDVYVTPPVGDPILVYDTKKGAAQRAINRDAIHGIHAVKTYLDEEVIERGGIRVSVDKAYAAIARDLMILANEQRKSRGESPLYNMVFTFPVAFAKDVNLLNRMQKAIEEVKIDGQPLKVVGRLPEPAAVAIDYLYYVQNIAKSNNEMKKEELTVLVYDLGYGTFDAALVKVGKKVGEKDAPYLVLDKDGLPDVGGKNFDILLEKEICSLLNKGHGFVPKSPEEKERIRKLAVDIKHELSENEVYNTEYQLPNSEYAEVEISKERFESLADPLMRKTLEVIMQMMERAESDNEKIDAIVLSGGGSRMPMVRDALMRLVENEMPVFTYRPSEAVSYGAARYASGIKVPESKPHPKPNPIPPGGNTGQTNDIKPPKVKLQNSVAKQLTDYSYGIAVGSSIAGEIRIFIPSGTELPAASQPITINSGMGRIDMKVYRSVHKREKREVLPKNDENCKSVIFLPFDLPANVQCQFTMVVEEDYNVTVTCRLSDGTVWKKGTADWLGERSKV